MKYTVLGANGFIGSHLVKFLKEQGNEVFTPDIRKQEIFNESLGNIIYSIGIPNFIERPFDAIEAHACLLVKLLEKGRFDSFLYISSARLYAGLKMTNEDEPILINPSKINDFYNISKVMGEAICLASKKEGIRIVRPSNVTGNNFTSHLFLPSIIRDAIEKNKITVHTKLASEKDYIYIDDLVKILPEISLYGKNNLYNIAFGKNIKSKEIVEKIVNKVKCEIKELPNAEEYSFPEIAIDRIKNEFNFKPISILDKIEEMVTSYKNFLNQK